MNYENVWPGKRIKTGDGRTLIAKGYGVSTNVLHARDARTGRSVKLLGHRDKDRLR